MRFRFYAYLFNSSGQDRINDYLERRRIDEQWSLGLTPFSSDEGHLVGEIEKSREVLLELVNR